MKINWSPTTAEEVVQNVETILGAEAGSVPLARELGVSQGLVDQPQSVIAAKLRAEAARAVKTYEPRAEIKAMRITGDVDGKLSATAVLEGRP